MMEDTSARMACKAEIRRGGVGLKDTNFLAAVRHQRISRFNGLGSGVGEMQTRANKLRAKKSDGSSKRNGTNLSIGGDVGDAGIKVG